MILADGKVALIGSANIDMRSFFVNFEIALLHYSAPDIEQLDRWAQDIISESIPYDEAITDKKVMPTKFTEDLVHLFVPLLWTNCLEQNRNSEYCYTHNYLSQKAPHEPRTQN